MGKPTVQAWQSRCGTDLFPVARIVQARNKAQMGRWPSRLGACWHGVAGIPWLIHLDHPDFCRRSVPKLNVHARFKGARYNFAHDSAHRSVHLYRLCVCYVPNTTRHKATGKLHHPMERQCYFHAMQPLISRIQSLVSCDDYSHPSPTLFSPLHFTIGADDAPGRYSE